MAAPIPPMLKYSIVYNLLNFPPILIKFMSKFIVCKVPYFKAQYLLIFYETSLNIQNGGAHSTNVKIFNCL